jgi:xanthine dehydrogenase accessory factor
MTDDLQVLAAARGWRADGLGVALATVISTWGSAPRPAGSLLAVNQAGGFEGSVSGGCVEAAVISEALQALADGRPRVLEYGVTDQRAFEVGLACGGTVRVQVQRLGDDRVLGPLLAAVAARRPVVLATALARGEVVLVDPGAPDPSLAPGLAAAALAGLERDRSSAVEVAGDAWFLRAFSPRVRVVMVGAVHVAQALAPMVRLMGWEPAVVDPRAAFASAERFGDVPTVCAWPDEGLARVGLDRRTALVALTHRPELDDAALAAALRSDAFYVGALGSRKTQAARRERLRELGLEDADLARIHGPVGLAIGSRSPPEIAVAILAEIVAVLRQPAPAPQA